MAASSAFAVLRFACTGICGRKKDHMYVASICRKAGMPNIAAHIEAHKERSIPTRGCPFLCALEKFAALNLTEEELKSVETIAFATRDGESCIRPSRTKPHKPYRFIPLSDPNTSGDDGSSDPDETSYQGDQ